MGYFTNQAGYEPPVPGFLEAAQQSYAFSADNRPGRRQYFQPSDIGGYGDIGNALLPHLLSMGPNEAAISQFSAGRNVLDRFESYRESVGTSKAARFAKDADAKRVAKIFNGAKRFGTGTGNLTSQQTEHSAQIGQFAAENMGMAIQLFGEDNVDMLMGSQGSATVMANRFHKAMKGAIDPTTGEMGYSVERSGRLSAQVFDKLYGTQSAAESMQGMRAGEVGSLVQELQARGQFGRSINSMPIGQQRGLLPNTLDADSLSKIVDQSGEVKAATDRGEHVTDEMRKRTEDEVKATFATLKDPSKTVKKGDIDNMVGGSAIMQNLDATRMADKVKGMTKSINAMQDIFGDAGRQGSIPELMKALDNMTQNAGRSMSDTEVTALVRQSQYVANKTGLGIDKLSQLQTDMAEKSRSMGGAGVLGVSAANDAALHMQAMDGLGAFDGQTFGSDGKAEAISRSAQLRVQAANSATTNMASAAIRMVDENGVQVKKGSEFEAYLAAVKDGQATYEYKGETRRIQRNQNDMQAMVVQGSDAEHADVAAAIDSKDLNTGTAIKHDVARTTSKAQAAEAKDKIAAGMATLFHEKFSGTVVKDLKASGTLKDSKDASAFELAVADSVAAAEFKMSNEDIKDPSKRNAVLAQATRDAVREQVRMRSPGASEAELDAKMAELDPHLSGAKGTQLAGAVYDKSEASAKQAGLGTTQNAVNQFGDNALEATEKNHRRAIVDGLDRNATGGLGNSNMFSRFSDAIADSTGKEGLEEILRAGLGFDDGADMDMRKADGTLARIQGYGAEMAALKPTESNADLKKYKQYSMLQDALVHGGKRAEEHRDALKSQGFQLTDAQSADLDAVIADPSKAGNALLKAKGYVVDAKLSDTKIDEYAKDAKTFTDINGVARGGDAVRSKLGTFVEDNIARGEDVLLDDRTLEQLGAGGKELIAKTRGSSDKISAILAQAKEEGRDVSLSDYHKPGSKLTDQEQADIGAAFKENQEAWDEVNTRKKTLSLPGRNTNENAARSEADKEETDQLAKDITAKRALEATQKAEKDKQNAAGMYDMVSSMFSPADKNALAKPVAPADPDASRLSPAMPVDGPGTSSSESPKAFEDPSLKATLRTDTKESQAVSEKDKPTDNNITVRGTVNLRADGTAELSLDGQRAAQQTFARG